MTLGLLFRLIFIIIKSFNDFTNAFFKGNKRSTVDGFEAHFGVNYLANFIIVNGLIENVKKSGEYK